MPGILQDPTHTKATVAVGNAVILAANADRRHLLIINDSGSQEIYIKIGGTAVKNEGIRLNTSGGSYELSEETGNLFFGAINAVTATGTALVLITEGSK